MDIVNHDVLIFYLGIDMVEYKFLCPKCKKLVDIMIETYSEYNDYSVTLDSEGNTQYELEFGPYESELIITTCPECDFVSESYRAEDFAVVIHEDMTIEPYGHYWELEKDKFKEIIAHIMMS